MFNRIINRKIARSYTNPISHYMNTNDYRVGIASERISDNETRTGRTWETKPFLRGLVDAFNDATNAEKIEFLQHPKSQEKLFEIIGSLFVHFGFVRDPHLSFANINYLLDMLSLDPETERQFYHSHHFTNHTKPFSDLNPRLDKLVLDALHKYPTIQMRFLSRSKIQAVLDDTGYYNRHENISKLLMLLRRLPNDLVGRPCDQEILADVPGLTRPSDDFDSRHIHYASVLISYMENPAQLQGHFNNYHSARANLIEATLITTEEKLRESNIEPDLFFGDICSPSYMDTYNNLLETLMPAVELYQKWQSAFFTNTLRPTIAKQVTPQEHRHQALSDTATLCNLHHYLSQEAGETACMQLLREGFSQDMIARISLHDMACPASEALSKQILTALAPNSLLSATNNIAAPDDHAAAAYGM
jgi:hypothetical protein